MPRKDREERLAYQREWYAKNSAKVKGWVSTRKHVDYAGVCRNCGGPTVGVSGPGSASEWCGKPACKSAQHKERREVFREASLRGHSVRKRRLLDENDVVSLDDLSEMY